MDQEQQCVNVIDDQVASQGPRALRGGAATVSGGIPDTEGDVIGQTQWQAIREAKATGMNISAIAREMGLDRKTVRAAVNSEHWQPYSRPCRTSKLDEHMDWLRQRAPQVHFSARILHQELRLQRGFAGSYEVVKVAVRPLRAQAASAALTQRRFETEPGEQAQVDWGQIKVRFGDQSVKVHIFVMTLGYSRRGFAEGFFNERLDNVLAAHEHAFAHFGGRCETMLYDRMRTVVHHDRDGSRLNATFEAFAQHWGFRIRLCQPYRAKTKGKVESGLDSTSKCNVFEMGGERRN
ncbi:MAG: IS21 family transposase [Burkholderiales bacterium]|nr:IS21 family transposase [Burkholderiales bacterium]